MYSALKGFRLTDDLFSALSKWICLPFRMTSFLRKTRKKVTKHDSLVKWKISSASTMAFHGDVTLSTNPATVWDKVLELLPQCFLLLFFFLLLLFFCSAMSSMSVSSCQ